MTVLWICGARIVGGAERVTLQLAELLRARGLRVAALCRPTGRLREVLSTAGIEAHFGNLGGAFNIGAVGAIRRTLQQIRPDIALVTTADEWVWSCLSRRPAPTRLVLVRHMVTPLAWRVRWLASQRADAIVAVSDAVGQSLLGGIGVRGDRIHRIYNPVRVRPRDTVPSSEDRARARAPLGLQQSARWVGFFGGLEPAKGLADVLRALWTANAKLGETHLLVGGRGDERSRHALLERVSKLQLDGRVHYAGEIERIEEALTAVDVVVTATHRRLGEALPATLIEAMACGTPVLAYATGGIPEIIGTDGCAGRLVKPDDEQALANALVALLADPHSAHQMAAVALSRVRDLFDPQRAADCYERLFLQLSSKDTIRS